MTQSIGDTIKKLRKELNMTQAQLAGDEMTKSMLSQIENNIAYPSMKNLKAIAQKLGKPVSFFLDEPDTAAVNMPVDEINNTLKECDLLIDKRQLEKALIKLNELSVKYHFDDQSKLSGNYYYILGRCLIYLNKSDEGEAKIYKAVEIFIKNSSYIEASKAYIELTNKLTGCFKYREALEIIEMSEGVYQKSSYRDIVHEIDILYNKSYIHSAMECTDEAIDDIDKAIQITQENKVYHMTDELYRFKAIMLYETERFDAFLETIKKAIKFAELTESKATLARAALNISMYYVRFKDIEKAQEYIKIYEENNDRIRFLYYIIKAVLYYDCGDFKKALEAIEMVDYTYYITHKYDYLLLWTGKTYSGMILYKLGKVDEAIEAFMESIKKLEFMPMSINLAYAYKNLSSIYYEVGDYKKAYEALNSTSGFDLPEYLI